jgi:hypothetical protein
MRREARWHSIAGILITAFALLLCSSICGSEDHAGVSYAGLLHLSDSLKRIEQVNPCFSDVDVSVLDAIYVIYRSSTCGTDRDLDTLAIAEVVVETDPEKACLPNTYATCDEDHGTVTAFGSLTLYCPSGPRYSGMVLVLREDRDKRAASYWAYGLRDDQGALLLEWPSSVQRVSRTIWMSPDGIKFVGFLRSDGSDWAFAVQLKDWLAVVDLQGETVYEGRVFSNAFLGKFDGEIELFAPVMERAPETDLASMPGDSPAEKRLWLNAFDRWNLRRIGAVANVILDSSLVRRVANDQARNVQSERSTIPVAAEVERVFDQLEKQGKVIHY